MFRPIFFLLLFLCGCATVPKQEVLRECTAKINRNMSGLKRVRFCEDIENLPSDDFDLASAVLCVSKMMDSSVDSDRCIDKLNSLSAQLSCCLIGKDSAKSKLNTMLDFVWRKGYIAQQPYWKEFRVNEFNEMWYLDYSDFIDLLDNKRGNCLTFSLLYLILAQRVGLPLYGVSVPRHLFVRYDDGRYVCNVETLARGFSFSDNSYISDIGSEYNSLVSFDSSFREKFRRYYLTNLSKKEVLGCFLANMSACLYKKEDYDGALKLITLANRCNPQDPDILTGLGLILLSKKKFKLALQVYKSQLEINPFKSMVYHYMGVIYRSLGKEDEIVFYFKKSLALKPYSFSEYWFTTVSYFELGRYDEALKRFNKILKFDNYHCRSWFYKAAIFSVTDRSDKAIACLRKAIHSNRIAISWIENSDYFKNLRDDNSYNKLITANKP